MKDTHLAGRPPMPRRILGTITPNNTQAWDNGTDAGVILHSTCVVSVDWDAGTVRLRSGGWESVTTKRRMNEAARAFSIPFHVFSKSYEWFVSLPNGTTVPFVDGMTFDAS